MPTQKHGRKVGRIRAEVASRPGSLEIIDFAQQVIAPGSEIHTDGAAMGA